MVYLAEARYAYQQADLAVSGSVIHSWSTDAILADEQYTGIRASATWRKGCLRLTAGADFHDLAGLPEMTSLQSIRAYDNRAVTFGFIYRF